MESGKLIISLDFELQWGGLDLPDIKLYKKNVLGGRHAIPKILDMFEKHGIHATWATVGILGLDGKKQLLENIPNFKPHYKKRIYSAYEHLDEIGNSEKEDPCSYAPSLVRLILSKDNQELGTHTFAHYYCNEEGADEESFRQDIMASVSIMKKYFGVDIKSLVFPRNQAKEEYVRAAQDVGITCWRGNPAGYKLGNSKIANVTQRMLRLVDSYIPVYGNLCTSIEANRVSGCCMASRFLRPYNQTLKFLEGLKVQRIKNQMLYAAKNHKVFHLWWHPHNFGENTEIMLEQLETILMYYEELKMKFGYESINMREYTNR